MRCSLGKPEMLARLMTSVMMDSVQIFCVFGGFFMLTSLALVFLLGLLMSFVCRKIKIPGIIGMLAIGIVLGPCCLNLLDSSILTISPDLRQMALIIILLKAGLSFNLSDLKKVGLPAILMSFLPASFEILALVLFGPGLLGISRVEAAVMGAVLGAVSPAVVVPRMVHLMEHGYGTDKSIPQLIVAGASCDDIFVIVLFTTFLGMAQGDAVKWTSFLNIPISIVLGILAGILTGLILTVIFERAYRKMHHIRNSVKVIMVLGCSFLLVALEKALEPYVALSGLLAVLSMACTIHFRVSAPVSIRLSEKFGKLWLAAELILFVLVGAAVDIRYTMEAGLAAVAVILIALAFRMAGVFLCLLGTKLSRKEKLYCMLAYIPKATVQAAIGSVPLSLGLPCGRLVLSVAVLAIIITAPLGALAMDLSYRKLLHKTEPAAPALPGPETGK